MTDATDLTAWAQGLLDNYDSFQSGKSGFTLDPNETARLARALIASEAARKLAEERLAKIVNVVRPFTDVAELFDNEVEGVGAMDTLSLWLNGDDEEPAWRAMDFTLGAFGDLSAVIKEITK